MPQALRASPKEAAVTRHIADDNGSTTTPKPRHIQQKAQNFDSRLQDSADNRQAVVTLPNQQQRQHH
jgi:hypothetical protein